MDCKFCNNTGIVVVSYRIKEVHEFCGCDKGKIKELEKQNKKLVALAEDYYGLLSWFCETDLLVEEKKKVKSVLEEIN